MLLGYSTYGLRDHDLMKVLPRLRQIGYEAIEICVADEWPTAPAKLTDPMRHSLARLLRNLKLPPPAFRDHLSLCLPTGCRDEQLARLHDACELAQALTMGAHTVLGSSLGPEQPSWDERTAVLDACLECADIAATYGITLAVIPTYGGTIGTPDRAAWLIGEAEHPNLRLCLDAATFMLVGCDLDEIVDVCAAHASHAHVKDGFLEEDSPTWLLPGDGDFDFPSYLALLRDSEYLGIVCADVPLTVSSAEAFDPWAAAEFCFATLEEAREVAETFG